MQSGEGKHTTAGFRKLRIIHNPKLDPIKQHIAYSWAQVIHASIEDEYISSTKFLAIILKQPLNIPCKHAVQDGEIFKFSVNVLCYGEFQKCLVT